MLFLTLSYVNGQQQYHVHSRQMLLKFIIIMMLSNMYLLPAECQEILAFIYVLGIKTF